jgi:hypothetical protein
MRFVFALLLLSVDGADLDRDSIQDALEQRLLERFLPRFHIAVGDCDGMPAEFVPGRPDALVKARNGTIYGQAFPVAGGVELHYFHLWGMDCGRVKHALDAEHVSALIVQDKGEWKARYWYAAAHEDTICDRGSAAQASALSAEWTGAPVWISRGKHASFLSESNCKLGCGSDKCDRSEKLVVKQVVNLGEPKYLMNGALWVFASGWPLRNKMESDFPMSLRTELDGAKGITAANFQNPAVQPVILAGSQTIDALALANSKTENAFEKAKKSVKGWLGKYLR